MSTFTATMFRDPGKGGWTFVQIPDEHAPLEAGAWGRTPVIATIDGKRHPTSAWRGREQEWLLPIPAKLRGSKGAGDEVVVSLEIDLDR